MAQHSKALILHRLGSGMDKQRSLDTQVVLMAVLTEVRAIFGDSQIRADDNFFALGGTSLDGVQLVMSLESEHGLQVDLADVFAAETLAQVAEATRQC
jgi:acyl carrier protein